MNALCSARNPSLCTSMTINASMLTSAYHHRLPHTDAEVSMSSTYVLRSVVPTALRRALVHDPKEDVSRGLLMVVLALIQLNGDKMDGGVCASVLVLLSL